MRRLVLAFVAALTAVLLASGTPATAANLLSFTATSTSVVSGKSTTAKVTLDAAAPTGGQLVTLQSANTSIATVPASVTVAAGKTYASVTIKARPVAATVSTAITASLGGVSKSLPVTVKPAKLMSFSVPAKIVGGTSASATVYLDGAAPSGGYTVSLTNSSHLLTVPDSVTIPSGTTSVRFTIRAAVVSSSSAASLTASLGSVTKSVSTSVVPPSLSSLTFSPRSIGTATTSTGTVKLNGPAPDGGAQVALSLPSGSPLTLPASVTIAEGATSATFKATAQPVDASTKVTVSAVYKGVTKTGSVTVTPPQPARVSFSTITITHNGTATGTVTLNAPALAGGADVELSANSAALTMPASVTVPAGSTSATFTVRGASPASQTAVTVTAQLAGGSKSGTITVKAAPSTLESVSLTPNPVGSTTALLVGVRLTGNAPTGGYTVSLSSSHPDLVPVPATLTVSAGFPSNSWNIRTGTTTSDVTVTVTATAGSKTVTTSITVKRFVLTSVTVPSAVTGGSAANGTVRISNVMPADTVVTLESSSPNVVVPATVTILAGQVTAPFQIQTSMVASGLPVTITARGGSDVVSAALTLNPLRVTGLQASGPGTLPTGTVSLNGAAPAGGLLVSLASASPARVTVPASVTVPAGATSAKFPLISQTGAAETATVTASANGSSFSASLLVPPATLHSLRLAEVHVYGGNDTTGMVYLTGYAPNSGYVVNLHSTDPSVATVPATVTVPAGSDRAEFTITLHASDAYAAAYIWASDATLTTPREILAVHELRPSSITFSANPVIGGNSVEVTVTLTGTVEYGIEAVGLTSFNTTIVPLPDTVQIPAGQRSTTFSVTTAAVEANTAVTVRARLNGSSRDVSLIVIPDTSVSAAGVEEPAAEATATPTATPDPAAETAALAGEATPAAEASSESAGDGADTGPAGDEQELATPGSSTAGAAPPDDADAGPTPAV